MTTIVTRAGKGAKLTWTEADANFNNLNTDKIETSDIGSLVQAYSSNLAEYAAVNPTTAGLALLDDADAAAQQTTLGLVIGVNVQAYDADIPTVAASQSEMKTGTEAALRSVSPLRVKQAVDYIARPHGQCRLVKSGANLVLQPHGGNRLIINGVSEEIPAAGVSLAPTSLGTSFYYIYAYMSGATMTLEASTTARATSSTTGNEGIEIKSGADTHTLVGAAYTSSSAFFDQASSRSVLSWFNRRNITGRAWLTANRTTTSTSIAELNTESRCFFLTWSDEAVSASACGTASNSTANQYTYMSIGWDGVAVLGGYTAQANPTAGSANSLAVCSVAAAGQLTEAAIHYTVLGGAVTANTGTYIGGSDNGSRCENTILIRG